MLLVRVNRLCVEQWRDTEGARFEQSVFAYRLQDTLNNPESLNKKQQKEGMLSLCTYLETVCKKEH